MNTNKIFTELTVNEMATIEGGWDWKEWLSGLGDMAYGAAQFATGCYMLDADSLASGVMSFTDGMGRLYYGASH